MLERLRDRARRLKDDVIALWYAAGHPGTPWHAKLLLYAIVAYALSPIDLIPDFIPVLGLLDEIVLLPFAIALVLRLVPGPVMAECRARAQAARGVPSRAGRIGAAIVVAVWAGLAALAAWCFATALNAPSGR
jgi:uncharacterized membrane protein YkvA (DUF1232 family)